MAAVGALLVHDLLGRRSEITRESELSAVQQSQLMARWFGTTVLAADYVLMDVLDRLAAEDFAASEGDRPARIHELLERKARTVPGLAGLGVYGPDCVFRHALDPARIGFRSNQRFCHDGSHRIGPELQVQYIPASKSADRRPSLLVSRNAVDSSGALAGGVLGVFSLDHAQRWIEQFGARGTDVMAMLDAGAVMLARAPPSPQEIGQVAPLPGGNSIPAGAWESGLFTGAWPLDGPARICAVTRVDQLPLAVVVGLDPDAVLREWRRRVWQLVPTYLLGSGLALAVLWAYLASLRQRARLARTVADLQVALANVKVLRGLLPICANCKKIRDDKGYWNQLEAYLHTHAGAEFTHGICPECFERLYSEEDEPDEAPREGSRGGPGRTPT